ncbi:MAG: tetratricopeptide repeat protein [Desulfuromonadales bacterium]|nr:tetratricopeptide repeat protein [Desulfuromonadales bacterium]
MIIIALFMIVFVAFAVLFLYFWNINPGEITVFLTNDFSISSPTPIIMVGTILVGLLLGNGVHILSLITHSLSHWRHDRKEKKEREIEAIYREGVGRLLSGDTKKAHTLLQKALDKDPVRIEAYIAMASTYLQEGALEESVNLLLKAKGIAPRSLEVLFKLATTYEEIGQEEKAISTYLDILTIEKNNRKALRCLRELKIRHGLWQDALDLQESIMKVGPGHNRLEEEKDKLFSLRYEVGRVKLENNDTDAAKAIFKTLIKERPDFVPARVSIGDAYTRQNRPEEATRIWREAYTALGKSIFLSRLEDLFLNAEDPSGLFDLYKDFIAAREDDLILRLFFGKLCLRLEMIDEAFEQLYALESAGIETPHLHLLLAEAHRRRNRIDEAIGEYKKALGIDGRLNLNYVCEDCGSPSVDWQSRCPACGTWGSFVVPGRQQIMKSLTVNTVGPIYHGERK